MKKIFEKGKKKEQHVKKKKKAQDVPTAAES